MLISNKYYDKGKWLVLVFLPAFAVLTKGLGDLYLWENVDTAVTTINLGAAFLGSLLQLSSFNYNKEDNQYLAGKGGKE